MIRTALIATLLSACTIGTQPPPQQPVGPPPGDGDAEREPLADGGERAPYDGDFNCNGTDDVVIRDAIIEVDGNGPTAFGSCDITIENSQIIATGVAAVVQGSGDIRVRNSELEGGQGGVSLVGSGDIHLENAQVSGGVSLVGSGDIHLTGSGDPRRSIGGRHRRHQRRRQQSVAMS